MVFVILRFDLIEILDYNISNSTMLIFDYFLFLKIPSIFNIVFQIYDLYVKHEIIIM